MQNQAELLNMTSVQLKVKNDAALSRVMGLKPSVISKLRNGKIPISAAILVMFHEKTGRSVVELKKITGYKSPTDKIEEAANV